MFGSFTKVSQVSHVYLIIMPECHCPAENHSFLRMAIWLRGLERWYLVLGGVAVGRGFEPQSDLVLLKNINIMK
jgi:hypothetical protein